MLPLQLPQVDVDKIEAADSMSRASFRSTIQTVLNNSTEENFDLFLTTAETIIFRLVAVILIWYVGRWLIKKLNNLLTRLYVRRRLDLSLQIFLQNLISISLTVLLIYIIISILGFNTSSFIALFASLGLAVGMALSGTLQNFAGGVLVLLMKPYHIGDYIESQGVSGSVKAIRLFNTVITTPDNKTIIIPNSAISNSIVNNNSTQPTRRVEWTISISYGDDFDVAKSAISDLIKKDKRIMFDPAPLIEIAELAESSVNVVIRVWVKAGDFWDVFYNMNEQIYKTLPAKGITFPYPTLDVTLKN